MRRKKTERRKTTHRGGSSHDDAAKVRRREHEHPAVELTRFRDGCGGSGGRRCRGEDTGRGGGRMGGGEKEGEAMKSALDPVVRFKY